MVGVETHATGAFHGRVHLLAEPIQTGEGEADAEDPNAGQQDDGSLEEKGSGEGDEKDGSTGGSEVGAKELNLNKESPEGELPAEHGAGPAEVDHVAGVCKGLGGADVGEVVVSAHLGERVGSKRTDSQQQCAKNRGAPARSCDKHEGSPSFLLYPNPVTGSVNRERAVATWSFGNKAT